MLTCALGRDKYLKIIKPQNQQVQIGQWFFHVLVQWAKALQYSRPQK
jgi:hypothetical protein